MFRNMPRGVTKGSGLGPRAYLKDKVRAQSGEVFGLEPAFNTYFCNCKAWRDFKRNTKSFD